MSVLGRRRIVQMLDYDEMDEARGSGWAKLKADGSPQGEIRLRRDEIDFIAPPRWGAYSTAC
jgi:hypothetical protein